MTRSCSAWLTALETKSALRPEPSPPNGSAIEPDWSSRKTMSVGLARVICAVYAMREMLSGEEAVAFFSAGGPGVVREGARLEAAPALAQEAEVDVDGQHVQRRVEHPEHGRLQEQRQQQVEVHAVPETPRHDPAEDGDEQPPEKEGDEHQPPGALRQLVAPLQSIYRPEPFDERRGDADGEHQAEDDARHEEHDVAGDGDDREEQRHDEDLRQRLQP